MAGKARELARRPLRTKIDVNEVLILAVVVERFGVIESVRG